MTATLTGSLCSLELYQSEQSVYTPHTMDEHTLLAEGVHGCRRALRGSRRPFLPFSIQSVTTGLSKKHFGQSTSTKARSPRFSTKFRRLVCALQTSSEHYFHQYRDKKSYPHTGHWLLLFRGGFWVFYNSNQRQKTSLTRAPPNNP